MRLFSESVTSTAYKITRTMTGVECDVCHKVVPVEPAPRNEFNRYFEVTTGHHDWGNDSCDSRETLDVCPECVDKYVSEYLKDCSDTGYLDVRTETIWGRIKNEYSDRPIKEGTITKDGHDWY